MYSVQLGAQVALLQSPILQLDKSNCNKEDKITKLIRIKKDTEGIKEMDMYSKRQYLMGLQKAYLQKDKTEKKEILDEYIKNTGHNRKYVIRQLNNINLTIVSAKTSKKRKCKYGQKILPVLEKIYKIFDCPCGQRMQSILEVELDRLRAFGEINITDQETSLLKTISSSTIDRKIRYIKNRYSKKGFTTTKPGTLLKQKIPIRLTEWDTNKIGFQEVDLVAHCGNNASGQFVYTISLVEIATGWWEGEAIMGKGQRTTFEGLKLIRTRSPFHWLGLDSDNGGEFINYHLWNYCQSENIYFTRSRPNRKNDNAYVEQKNWTHVRQVVGYARYDTEKEMAIINDLYRNDLRLFKNFFQPTMKLKTKKRIGGKLKRIYEKPQTPYQKLLHSNQLSDAQMAHLKKIYATLNPAQLSRNIDQKLALLFSINELKNCSVSNQLITKNNLRKEALLVTC